MYKRHIKRILSFTIALIAIIILSPIMIILALLIKLTSKGPVIFKQERLGKNGQVFEFYKFRSMCVGAEKIGSGVYSGKGDARVTGLGKVLRATSLDELPQLFNILKGEMNFVGPRPPLTYHPWPIEEYTQEQLQMFEVAPGITGWAQVNGRKEVEWNKRIELSCWYVQNLTFLLDIKILFMTVFKVLANADNHNSTETVSENSSIPVNTEKTEKEAVE